MSSKSKLLLFAVLCTIFVFTGCGAIIHGSKQVIEFQSTPSGATVEVLDNGNEAHGTCETPCSLKLKRKHKYKVIISKDGYSSSEFNIERRSDGWIWGNIVFGGVIGLIVDFTTGAAYKLDPTMLNATLTENTIGNIPKINGLDGLVFIDFDDLSPEEQERVRKLISIKL